MDVGEKMRELRKREGYTLRELGKKLNIAHSHLSMIETGKKKPNLDLLEAVANVYGVSVSYLVGDKLTEVEESFIGDSKQLSVDELINRYNLVVGDRPATKNEIEEAVKYILIKRQMERN